LVLELGNDLEDDVNIRMDVRTLHMCRPTKQEEAFT